MEETIAYIKKWKKTKWYAEEEHQLADDLLSIIEKPTEEAIISIDGLLGTHANTLRQYQNFLLDVRNMIRPATVEKEEEECTPIEADSPSVLAP